MTDVVVVGAGIAGGAMATVLARAGLDVLVLEKTLEHRDVVRGEWIAPWGVRETVALGLYDLYRAAGAHHVLRHVTYHEDVDPAECEAAAVDLQAMAGDGHPPLCLGHPRMCNLLDEAAVAAGASLLRGVTALQVTPGEPPQVLFQHGGVTHDVRPRLVIGADGRNGVVAGQVGCTRQGDPEHHLFSGMLVEGVHDWPEDLQAIGTEGDVNWLIFPQGGGRLRCYIGYPSDQRTRLVGPQAPRAFLDAFDLRGAPRARAVRDGRPASRPLAYPNADAWVDDPVRPGVVLVGDAAGRNDPIIGQGLSITHRDVRIVSDLLLGGEAWSPALFAPYVAERRERMGRLRTVARLTSIRDSEFGPPADARRAEIRQRLVADPDLGLPFAAAFVGPDALPPTVFAADHAERLLGGPLWPEA